MQVQYLEIVTPDVDAVCATYAKIHGVQFSEPDAALGGARTANLAGGGRIGVRAPMIEAEEPVVRPYVLVEDIEAATAAAEAAGAQITHPPMEIPGSGPFAWTYDGVAWIASLGQWTNWALVALRFLEGPMVLELAHGPGHLQVALAQAGVQVTGLDLSPQMGRLTRRRLRRADLPVPLVRGRAQTLPLPDGAFNSVVATFPTEFIIDPRTTRVGVPRGRPHGESPRPFVAEGWPPAPGERGKRLTRRPSQRSASSLPSRWRKTFDTAKGFSTRKFVSKSRKIPERWTCSSSSPTCIDRVTQFPQRRASAIAA